MRPSTLGFFPDFASESPTSVRGELSACVRKYLLLSSVRMVIPSAANGPSPLAGWKCGGGQFLVVGGGEECAPVGRERAKPARMIEMRMRVDDVSDSLGGNQALG